MIRLCMAFLVLSTSLVSADEIAAPSRRAPNPNGGVGAINPSQVDPGIGTGRARMPPPPRFITRAELNNLVRSLPPILRRPQQQCLRQFQPDRRINVRMIVSMTPGTPADARIIARPRNPQLEECLRRWTLRVLRSRLGNRRAQNPIRVMHAYPLQMDPVVDNPPPPNQNPTVVRQAVERALAGQRSIFRRCFAGVNAGVATLRIQVQANGSLQLLGASVPPGTGTAPLNCLGQLVATTPTGLTGNVPQQTVEWTIQLMEPMPGTEPPR